MAIAKTALSKLYVGNINSIVYDASGYAALTTWTEVKRIVDLGAIGPSASKIERKHVNDGWVRRLSGVLDAGELAIVADADASDPGQVILRQNVGKRAHFKIEMADTPSGGGTPTVFYFAGQIFEARDTLNTADDVHGLSVALGIDGPSYHIPASMTISLTPSPGALTAGEVGSAYSSTTFAGSGGIGTVAYQMTAGEMPPGMSLNPATGALTGTPTTAGTYALTVTAYWTGEGLKSQEYTIVIAP